MADVAITLGTARSRAGVDALVSADGAAALTEPPFTENLSTFDIDDYVIVDGIPVADSGVGGNFETAGGVDSSTVVTTPLDPYALFPEAFAHWVPGLDQMSLDGTLYRWWPVGGSRTSEDPRMSLFKTTSTGSGQAPYGDGTNAPKIDEDYTYQAFGRQLTRKAVVFPGVGHNKIDPEANFTSATFAVTAVYHPGDLDYYGIFEAAQVYHSDSDTLTGDPLVLRWHHGQLRLYHSHRLVLTHESHRRSAAPVTMVISLDAVTDVGRFYCLDENRTTRTFNTEGMDYVALLGIFGGLGQGQVINPYKRSAEMDVLDVCLWDHAMDWPEMQSKVNLLALAYGVGV